MAGMALRGHEIENVNAVFHRERLCRHDECQDDAIAVVAGLFLAGSFLATAAWLDDRKPVEAFQWMRLVRQEVAVLAGSIAESGRKIVDHHGIPALEGRDQTRFDVGQENISTQAG
jgi:hypothetical protein